MIRFCEADRGQNSVYPIHRFPEIRRLVIDDGRDHPGSRRIFGVAQAQSSDRTLSFTSQGRRPAEVAA
jgi:hypothetical protein